MSESLTLQQESRIVFREAIDPTYIDEVLCGFAKGLLAKSKWRIVNRKEDPKEIRRFFDILKECSILELALQSNSHKHVIADVSKVSFPNLQKLTLFNNGIVSLENLSGTEFPKLLSLSISNNHISSIRSLRKIKADSLETLIINGNKITNLQNFSENNFPELTEVHLEWGHEHSQNESSEWIFKLQSSKLKAIYLRSSRRLAKPELVKIQGRKFLKLGQ